MGRRTGRRQGRSDTRDSIIRVARELFAESGFGGTSVRSVAREAKVDAALVHHFFTSKTGLFTAAVEDVAGRADCLDPLVAEGPDGLGECLVRGFLELCESTERRASLFAVIRSSASYDEAARVLGSFVVNRILAQVVNEIHVPQPELRAMLVGSQLIGMATVRFVIGIEPLASADPETVVAAFGPVVQRYLTGDLDTVG